MKVHTTNYINTFIEVADDCPAETGEIPPVKKSEKTIAAILFELINENPYRYTSDEIIFKCFVIKNNIKESEISKNREAFFSKGQACLRSSPLTKRYGYGIHFNGEGKIALYGLETEEYKKLSKDKNLRVVKAMRSKKNK
ncbi:hypothetical protein MYP_2067 [Sporocytophaga myxococcoides]|uniref:Uncharacterized protein n=1 Tax=Sporocytophaga myxococcoides TaxID=153721 RepID=A0A098LEJ7_9BACT|nr:DUF6157 family protein [Sporocytophaga myxococcoides]GAL84839.1 hypothetical protein MYP_2067 [Sporocytophaga myxococcoides]